MDRDELKHAIDHALSDLDFSREYNMVDGMDRIEDAKKQLLFIRDELIDKVIQYEVRSLFDKTM
jgi:hypothetical protein